METISFLVFQITILFIFTSIPPIVLSANTTPFKLKLIHHHSLQPRHPYNITDIHIEGDPSDTIIANMFTPESRSVFLVNISAGNPPISRLLAMDTGSSLLWTICNSAFATSSTYHNNSCNSYWCEAARGRCDSQERYCTYDQAYGDHSFSTGTLANESFIFETTDEGTVIIPDIVFGCGKNNQFASGDNLDGILGLGAGRLSIIRQMQITRFSYCVGNIRDSFYNYNQLIIGGEVDLIYQDNSSPLELHGEFYYLNLEGISVGDKRLDIGPEEFTRDMGGNGGVIIDSGTTMTYLTRRPFDLLRAEIDSHMDKRAYWLPHHTTNADMLCYNGVFVSDIEDFPVLKFHFKDGMDLELDVDSLFDQSTDPDYYCLAVEPDNNMNIIGMKAHQYYNTVYDLEQKRISMQRMDCSYLQD